MLLNFDLYSLIQYMRNKDLGNNLVPQITTLMWIELIIVMMETDVDNTHYNLEANIRCCNQENHCNHSLRNISLFLIA